MLVDKTEYEESDSLGATETSGVSFRVTREVDNMTLADNLLHTNISQTSLHRGPGVTRVALTLTGGRYQALVTPIGGDSGLTSARLTQTTLAFVTAI